MSVIPSNLQGARARIAAAAAAAGRMPDEVRLVAVSKTVAAHAIVEAVAAGQRAFGENYVSEAVTKRYEVLNELSAAGRGDLRLEWHLIGPIQSNKTRLVAECFDWVHSIDRLRVAQRLSDQRPAHLAPLKVLLQVNISGESTKSGVAPGDVLELARSVATLPRLALCGLMAIPAPAISPDAQRAPYAHLRRLAMELRAAGLPCEELSMGMSDDLEPAIAEGATLVRVGTAIFGKRPGTGAG